MILLYTLISVVAASQLFGLCVLLYYAEFIMQTHRIIQTTKRGEAKQSETKTQPSTNANIKHFVNHKTNYFANYLISVL